MKLLAMITKRRTPRKTNPLWVVDVRNMVCTRLPEDKPYTVCIDPHQWEPGKIYVPVGAKVVCAPDVETAVERVAAMMHYSPAVCNELVSSAS